MVGEMDNGIAPCEQRTDVLVSTAEDIGNLSTLDFASVAIGRPNVYEAQLVALSEGR